MMLAAHRRNLVKLVDLPLGDRFAAEQNHSGKGAGPQTAADRETSDPIGKVKNPALEMNVGRLFEKNRRVQIPARHVHSPTLKYTERFGIEYGAATESNPTGINSVCFRPMAVE